MGRSLFSARRVEPRGENPLLDFSNFWTIEYSILLFFFVLYRTWYLGYKWALILAMLSTPAVFLIHTVCLTLFIVLATFHTAFVEGFSI